MSTDILTYFFPTAITTLQAKYPSSWAWVVSPATQAACTRHTVFWKLPSLTPPHAWSDTEVAWPALIPIAVLGALVGVVGAVLLLFPQLMVVLKPPKLRDARQEQQQRQQQQQQQQQQQGRHQAQGEAALKPLASQAVSASVTDARGGFRRGRVVHVGWPLGFLSFAVMNVSAVLCHCLLPKGSALQHHAIAVDVAATGASCLCLGFAAVASLLGRRQPVSHHQQQQQAKDVPPAATSATAGLPLLLALLAAFVPSALQASLASVPWANEVAYLGLMVLAAPCVFMFLVRELTTPGSSRRGSTAAWVWACTACTALAASTWGLPVEPWLCYVTGTAVNMLHVFFFACNVIFLGLGGFLLSGN